MSTPVSSSQHSCHGSSRCAMSATAARWGRAPDYRRYGEQLRALEEKLGHQATYEEARDYAERVTRIAEDINP